MLVPSPLYPYSSPMKPLQYGLQRVTPGPFGGWGLARGGRGWVFDVRAGGGFHLSVARWGTACPREFFCCQSSGLWQRKASWWSEDNQPIVLYQRWLRVDRFRSPWAWGLTQGRAQRMARVVRPYCGHGGVPHLRPWRWRALVDWSPGWQPSRCWWSYP